MYNKSYKDVLFEFIDLIDSKIKEEYYDFNNNTYTSFKKFCVMYYEKIVSDFDKFFSNQEDEILWSNNHKKDFIKKIKIELIKEV
jgi:hypothetical protein